MANKDRLHGFRMQSLERARDAVKKKSDEDFTLVYKCDRLEEASRTVKRMVHATLICGKFKQTRLIS